ncbi:MAG: 1,4-alpha-glucan branching protein GlgB [Candidatus Latescibacterota bacterium]|jgi:1,4-alpha-glucan branching enzyme
MTTTITDDEIRGLLSAELADPFAVLGMHPLRLTDGAALAVRAFLPEAREVTVVARDGDGRYPAERIHPEGIYEVLIPGASVLFAYELEVVDGTGNLERRRDPYSFWPLVGEYDQYLFNEGSHLHVFDRLGAHPTVVDGAGGVLFAVWAPNARQVSLVGDFNRWDGRRHPLRSLGTSGIWELFVPGLGEGEVYKYQVKARDGGLHLKADPYGFGCERPPRTASVVRRIDAFPWADEEWMAARPRRRWFEEPLAVYEVHLGSWRRHPETGEPLGYRELAHQLADYALDLGFTHLEFMPVAEHPFDGSWGYQVTGYFAPTSRFGEPADFAYLVDHLHRRGLGVIIDWVPGHFPRDAHGLARFDGTCLYEHEDPRQGLHPDWDTLIFNYGRSEVRSFLLSNAIYWLERYHVDGLRVDAVASMLYLDYSRGHGDWVPNRYGGRENLEAIEFLRQLNTQVYARCPGAITIAEESTAWPAVSRPVYAGGLGFGFKWNMGWMNDVLRYAAKDPVHRKFHHSDLTFSLLYAFSENFILPFSHDEVVHGKRSLLDKMPGDAWQKFANLRLFCGFLYGHPGKKHLFMGGELGQWREWNHQVQLDWELLAYEPHQGVQRWIRDLNHLYRRHPAMHRADYTPDGFQWVDCQDVENGVIAFLRRDPESGAVLAFALNLTPVPRHGYRLGLPCAGTWRERLNSDAAWYGGSGLGNGGAVAAVPVPWHGQPQSAELVLPPLSILVLEPDS